MAARIATSLIAALFAVTLFASGQDIVVKDDNVSAIVARFASERQADRATAFYDLIALGTLDSDNHAWPVQLAVTRIMAALPAKRDELTHALIALLDREDAAPPGARAAGDGYLGDLVGAVAALRDPGALPGLLRHIDSGRIAARGLTALGDPAVAPVAAVASDNNPRRRQAAIIVLGGMIVPDSGVTPSPANQAAIRRTLIRALADAEPSIRIESIRGLAPVRGDDVSSALRARLSAESDTRVLDALKTALAGRR